MKQLGMLLAGIVVLSSSSASLEAGKTYWALFGVVETSTMTPTELEVPTGPIAAPILCAQETPDCYQLGVTPNGTITRTWVSKPK